MISLCFLIVGLLIGYFERSGREKFKDLYARSKEVPEPEVGATDASYGRFNPLARVNQDSEVGISEPKSPQLLEWEEQERLEKAQLKVKVK
jgi:hypothetical protein